MMPKLLDTAAKRIMQRGVPAKSAWPIAVASLQKAGDLRKGSVKATPKGVSRGKMSQAQRQKSPP